MDTLENLFMRKVPVKLVLLLKNGGSICNATKLSRLVETSPFMIRLILSKMEEHGMVSKSKEGRNTFYVLTEQGQILASALQNLSNCVSRDITEKKTNRNTIDEVRSGGPDGRSV